METDSLTRTAHSGRTYVDEDCERCGTVSSTPRASTSGSTSGFGWWRGSRRATTIGVGVALACGVAATLLSTSDGGRVGAVSALGGRHHKRAVKDLDARRLAKAPWGKGLKSRMRRRASKSKSKSKLGRSGEYADDYSDDAYGDDEDEDDDDDDGASATLGSDGADDAPPFKAVEGLFPYEQWFTPFAKGDSPGDSARDAHGIGKARLQDTLRGHDSQWAKIRKVVRDSDGKSKLLLLVRHGEAAHNAWGEDITETLDVLPCTWRTAGDLLDPSLTGPGVNQIVNLRSSLLSEDGLLSSALGEDFGDGEASIPVIVSPLARAMQTALIASSGVQELKRPFHVTDYVRERIEMNTPFELRRPFSLLPEDEALEASESIVASGEPHCKFHRGLTELYDERSFELNLITRENLQCRVDHVQPLSYTTCDELALTHYSDFEMGNKQPESMLALMSRVKVVLAGIFEKYADDETVMIVTHSDWIISALMELYPDTLGFVPQNGEVVPIVVEDMREGKSDQHQHRHHGSFVVADAKHPARDRSDHYKEEHEKNAGKVDHHYYAVAKKESTAKTDHKDLDEDDDERKGDGKHSSGEEKRHSSTHSTSDAEHKKAAAADHDNDDHKESKHDGHHHSSDKDDAKDDDDSAKSLKKSDGKHANDSDAEAEAKAKTERKEDDSKNSENSDAAHELFESSAKNDKKTSTKKKKEASLGSNPLRDRLSRALDNINEHFDRLAGEDDR